MGVEESELEVLLVCFDDPTRARKQRRRLGEQIEGRGGIVLDEVVIRVDHKGRVQATDPRRVVAGTLTPALTWGVFGLLATGEWSSLLLWAVLGGICGGVFAYYTEHVLTRKQFTRIGAGLTPDSSALLLYLHGAEAKDLVDEVPRDGLRVASAVSIAGDLSTTVTGPVPASPKVTSAAGGMGDPDVDALLTMFVFRYAGADSAAHANAQAQVISAGMTEPTAQAELLVRADVDGRTHVVSPSAGVRAIVPSDVLVWGLFGVVYGGVVGLAGDGGVLGFAEGAAVTGILWAAFGLVAGALYGLWAGRGISARRFKPLRPLLPPDTSIALCWAAGPVHPDSIATWMESTSGHVSLRFTSTDGGAVLEA